MCKVSNFV